MDETEKSTEEEKIQMIHRYNYIYIKFKTRKIKLLIKEG